MNFSELLRGDFIIQNGTFFNGKYGQNGRTDFYLTPWGSYKDQYRISGDYSAADFWIGKDGYGDWYIYKGTWNNVCRIYHQSGMSWTSYY